MSLADWWPDWSGQTGIVVASGPSAKDAPLDAVRGRAKIIAVNNSYQLAPWADALYGCDARWWDSHKGVPSFGGLKISRDVSARNQYPSVRLVRALHGQNVILTEKRGYIGWGGNGGFHALNLAVQFGCKRIVLVGFDMTLSAGDHWHGSHGGRLNDPRAQQVEAWRQVLDDNADRLASLGVEVLNASPVSALTKYPKVDLRGIFNKACQFLAA